MEKLRKYPTDRKKKREVKKAVFTNSYNAKKAVAPVQKKAPDDKMKSPKTGNDSLMVIWTTMILAVLEKEKRFSLYKEKCNMKKISLLFCLIIRPYQLIYHLCINDYKTFECHRHLSS